MPAKFGYSQAQADSFFEPDKTYARCGLPNNSIVSVKDNHLIVKCNSGLLAEFVICTLPEDETLGDIDFKPNWKKYTQPVDLGRAEFAFGRCTGNRKQAVLVNRFNPAAAARAQAKTELLGTSLGVKPRPLSFFIVMFDSVSRQHFYRNFPKTIEFLNTAAEGKDFALYDFRSTTYRGRTRSLTWCRCCSDMISSSTNSS
jgi:hypothetical protein